MFSVVAHEVAHGFAAYALGDNTAKYQGRLTLNPLAHLEWFGSVILPTLSYFLGGFIIGWAKPVPFNPYNLRNQKWGEAIVAGAGPFTNICIALFFGLLIRFSPIIGITSMGFLSIASIITFTNLLLAVFNLVPIPPLDGSKILFSLFPTSMVSIRQTFEMYGSTILIFFIFFLWQFIAPVVGFLFSHLVGLK